MPSTHQLRPRRFAFHVVLMSVANVASRITFTMLGIWITRFLGPAEAGLFFTAYAYVNVYTAIPDFGISPLVVREAARYPRRERMYYGSGLAIFVVFGSVVYGAMLALAWLLNYQPVVQQLIAILGLVIVARAGEQVANTVMQLKQQLHITALVQLGAAGFSVALIYRAARAGANVVHISWILTAVAILSALVLLGVGVFLCRPSVRLSVFKHLILETRLFGIAGVLSNVYLWGAPLALSWAASEEAVGYYSAAFRLISMTYILPTMLFNQVLLPVMFAWAKTDTERLRKAYITFSKYMAMLGTGVAVGAFALRHDAITLVYGDQFGPSVPVLAVLAWIAPVRFLSSSMSALLTVTDNMRMRVAMQGFVLCVLAVLCAALIPRWGMMGAAFAGLGTEIALVMCYGFGVGRKFHVLRLATDLRIPQVTLAAVALGVGCHLLGTAAHVIAVSALGVVLYLAALFLLGFFDDEDKRLAHALLKVRKRTQQKTSHPGMPEETGGDAAQ